MPSAMTINTNIFDVLPFKYCIDTE
jgi:hypothetical protein